MKITNPKFLTVQDVSRAPIVERNARGEIVRAAKNSGTKRVFSDGKRPIYFKSNEMKRERAERKAARKAERRAAKQETE